MSAGTFDHRDDGTPAGRWDPLISRLRHLAPPAAGDHLLVLAAHPDDETLGAGGLIAAAAAAGVRVSVVVATDGEASHPRSPTRSPRWLAARRHDELRAAVATLAPSAEVYLLGLADGHLADDQPGFDAALAAVVDSCTHLVTPWLGDGHPDHAACSRAGAALSATTGALHWQYPIWAWHWSSPAGLDLPRDRMFAVPLDASARAAKAAALECYASQRAPLSPADGDEPVLGPQLLAHFQRDSEVFLVTPLQRPVDLGYFERLYAREPDPWGLQQRYYEQRKRALLLASLVRPRFRRAFEPGCSTGLLTAELARRCDTVVGCDLAEVAIRRARARMHGATNVALAVGAIPEYWPDGTCDLIVISEVGYYCPDLDALSARVDAGLDEDGVLLACHWRHVTPLHAQTAEAVHAALGRGRQLVVDHSEEDFLLQLWTRSGRSVAAADGLSP